MMSTTVLMLAFLALGLITVDADTDAVIEIVDDGVGFVGAGLDTADSADTGSVVQSDRAMLQSTVDPLSVDGSCSINQLGGGTEDGGGG